MDEGVIVAKNPGFLQAATAAGANNGWSIPPREALLVTPGLTPRALAYSQPPSISGASVLVGVSHLCGHRLSCTSNVLDARRSNLEAACTATILPGGRRQHCRVLASACQSETTLAGRPRSP